VTSPVTPIEFHEIQKDDLNSEIVKNVQYEPQVILKKLFVAGRPSVAEI
jgi:hypothetical protein